MRLLYLTILLILSIGLSSAFAQGSVPTPCGDVCAFCEAQCQTDCFGACLTCINDNCGEAGIPINSHVVLLLLSGMAYGITIFRNRFNWPKK